MYAKTLFDFRKATYEVLSSVMDEKIYFDGQIFQVMLDVNDLLFTAAKQFYKEGSEKLELTQCELTSVLLNFISYFRYYFYNKGCNALVFMYCNLNELHGEFENESSWGDLKELFRSELELTKIMCKYIPGAYMLENDNLDYRLWPSLIKDIEIGNDPSKIYKLIVSKKSFNRLYLEKFQGWSGLLNLSGKHTKLFVYNDYANEVANFGDMETFCRYIGDESGDHPKALIRVREDFIKDPHKFSKINLDAPGVKERAEANREYYDYKKLLMSVNYLAELNRIESQLTDFTDPDSLETINRNNFSRFPIDVRKLYLGY